MLTVVWRTDLHLSDRAPRARIDDWTETLCGKIRQVGQIAREVKAKAILDGGDFFHIRSPTRNSHQLVVRAVEAHSGYPCPVYCCIGNHDVKYGDYTYLGEQPLGVLFQSGAFSRLYDEHELLLTDGIYDDGGDFYQTLSVRVVGVPYHGTEYDLERLSSITKGEEDYLVVVAHLLASPKGGSMFEGEDILSYSQLSKLDPDVICFGHWHKNQGVEEIAPGKWVVNIGSLSRGALNQDDLSRTPSVAIIKFDHQYGGCIDIEQRPLKVVPPEEVFDLRGKALTEARSTTVEKFVDSIQETLAESTGRDIPDLIREMDVPDKVKEQAILYWEQSDTK